MKRFMEECPNFSGTILNYYSQNKRKIEINNPYTWQLYRNNAINLLNVISLNLYSPLVPFDILDQYELMWLL